MNQWWCLISYWISLFHRGYHHHKETTFASWHRLFRIFACLSQSFNGSIELLLLKKSSGTRPWLGPSCHDRMQKTHCYLWPTSIPEEVTVTTRNQRDLEQESWGGNRGIPGLHLPRQRSESIHSKLFILYWLSYISPSLKTSPASHLPKLPSDYRPLSHMVFLQPKPPLDCTTKDLINFPKMIQNPYG